MLAMMQRNWITRALLVGMQNDRATLEKCLAVSHKINLHLPYDSCTLRNLFHKNENVFSYNNLYLNIYSNFIYNRQKREIIQMSLSASIQSYHLIEHRDKKEQMMDRFEMYLKEIMLSDKKKSQVQKVTYCIISFI